MSLLNNTVINNGFLFKPITNKYSITTSNFFSTILNFGGPAPSFQENLTGFSVGTNKITITEQARYRIQYSFLSKGIFNFATNGIGRFQFGAVNSPGNAFTFGKIEGSTAGIQINDFGASSYYTFSNDTLNPSVILSNSTSFSWSSFFYGVYYAYLENGAEVFFEFAGTNLVGTHNVGFDGYIILEKIS